MPPSAPQFLHLCMTSYFRRSLNSCRPILVRLEYGKRGDSIISYIVISYNGCINIDYWIGLDVCGETNG